MSSDRYRVVVRRPQGKTRYSNPRSKQSALRKANEIRIKLKGPANVTVERIEVDGKRVWPDKSAPPSKSKSKAKGPKAPPVWAYDDYNLPDDPMPPAPSAPTPTPGKHFGKKQAHKVIMDLPVGSLFATYTKGKAKRHFYMKSTKGGVQQLTLEKFRPVESAAHLADRTSKGVVIEEGDGKMLSFPVASGWVDDYRAVSSPKKSWAWESGKDYTPLPPPPKAQSAGGVLIRKDGKVLLRAPSGAFGGTYWSHAKGRIDKGEDPQVAALREILEETGWHAEVIAKIPGVFQGTTTENTYFVARPLKLSDEPAVLKEKPGPRPGFRWPDWESVATQWVTPEEAREMLNASPNATARKRDLAVLDAAYALWNELQGKPKKNRVRRNPHV